MKTTTSHGDAQCASYELGDDRVSLFVELSREGSPEGKAHEGIMYEGEAQPSAVRAKLREVLDYVGDAEVGEVEDRNGVPRIVVTVIGTRHLEKVRGVVWTVLQGL